MNVIDPGEEAEMTARFEAAQIQSRFFIPQPPPRSQDQRGCHRSRRESYPQ